jgi:hypothetical protein
MFLIRAWCELMHLAVDASIALPGNSRRAVSLAQCKPCWRESTPQAMCILSDECQGWVRAFLAGHNRQGLSGGKCAFGLVPCNQQCRTYDPIADVTLRGM